MNIFVFRSHQCRPGALIRLSWFKESKSRISFTNINNGTHTIPLKQTFSIFSRFVGNCSTTKFVKTLNRWLQITTCANHSQRIDNVHNLSACTCWMWASLFRRFISAKENAKTSACDTPNVGSLSICRYTPRKITLKPTFPGEICYVGDFFRGAIVHKYLFKVTIYQREKYKQLSANKTKLQPI